MALAAVDIALWDIKAQAAGLPLWKLVGGDKDGCVPSYNTDAGWLNFEVPRIVDEMQAIIDQGWRAVKMKVGLPDSREDHRRVEAVRTAIGDDIDLMIDVNQLWDMTTAITWAPRFEEFNIRWLEEPLDPATSKAMRVLPVRRRFQLIALGEHVYTRTMFRDYIERGVQSATCRSTARRWPA